MVRNKQNGFPPHIDIKEPNTTAENSPKRANRTINTRPQERMQKSNKEPGDY
jgi:hypothetical protein